MENPGGLRLVADLNGPNDLTLARAADLLASFAQVRLAGGRQPEGTQTPIFPLTSHLKGFSPECWRECTFKDMLRLNDFPHVSQVKGMSLV